MSDTPTRAFTFPGQGAQAVGMGRELAESFAPAKAVFDEVDEALGLKLTSIMWDGPEEDLTLTMNTQPALMAVSMAFFRVLEAEVGLDLSKHAKFVAGHSLGEYSALCAAGSLDLTTTARLLRLRGEAMQRAVPAGKGAMAATLGLANEKVAEAVAAAAAETGEPVSVANDNADGQVVISGSKAGVDRACELAKEAGAKRAMPLAVSAPFHSSLMQAAADEMADALKDVEIAAPSVPVVANVRAEAVSDAEILRTLLVEQITGQVRWRESVIYMRDQGVSELVECGSGKVLTGLTKWIDKSIKGQTINSVDAVRALAEAGL
ncbi:ACP S-malonyltransferase [Pyruvatibacter sp.]|uniref:ACP S-malonyltransferase n=1 Tax=Pyruvatibacter sp. TaxID=1981328 RepID=UPI0032ECA649